jgi:hypothetical protein
MLVSRNNKKIFYFYVLIYSIYSLYLGKLTIVGGGHSGRYETFLCNYEKNIFLALSDDSKNILENRFFNQTSS